MKQDLKKAVRRYSEIYLPRFVERIRQFCEIPFDRAFEIATNAREVDGTIIRHVRFLQGKKKKYLKKAVSALCEIKEQLRKCDNFEELHALISSNTNHIPHIKKVYCYDVALRIGAANGFLPEKVYVHATKVKKTARELELVINADETIDFGTLHLPLKKLKPYEVEDFLCNFEKLKKL